MATTIAAECTALVEHLVEGGVRAAVDPARLNVPGVWIEVVTVEPNMLDGGGTISIGLNLIVPDGPYDSALANLDDLLGQVVDLVDVFGDVTPQTVVLPDGSNCPSWLATVQRSYERTP